MKAFIKNPILFSLLLVIVSNLSHAQIPTTSPIETLQVNYKETLALFMKAERKAMQRRKYVQTKRIYSTPADEEQYWVTIFKKEAPDLLSSPEFYKNSLLKILEDTSIKKDEYLDSDVVQLLHPICLDDYVEVVQHIHRLYKAGKVNERVLLTVIMPSMELSDNVYIHYKNEGFRNTLSEIAETLEIKSTKQSLRLKESIDYIFSNEHAEGCEDLIQRKRQPHLKNRPCN